MKTNATARLTQITASNKLLTKIGIELDASDFPDFDMWKEDSGGNDDYIRTELGNYLQKHLGVGAVTSITLEKQLCKLVFKHIEDITELLLEHLKFDIDAMFLALEQATQE